MFRDLLRKKQQLSQEECLQVLAAEKRSVLSVLGDDGYPYGLPINHFYNEDDGKIYFHSGSAGHKLDALRRCNKASLCVYDQGFLKEGDWALNVRSVIVFGRVAFIEDREKIFDIARRLSHKFTDDEGYIEYEIQKSGQRTVMFALTPEHICGKLVNEK
ncbi:MAG: pyridoxamine 5'-phosphate oxidase family protein [Oscillospiraceae bacterium]|nr:pyridoxamine 5'-phosphate oxidase family protein [Oscillospiraceae bacterium]